MSKAAPIEAEFIEARCEACHGSGFPPVQQVAPGRRIYPAPCKQCGGKGRVAASRPTPGPTSMRRKPR